MPVYFEIIGDSFICKAYPGSLSNFTCYSFRSSTAFLPLTAKLHSLVPQNINDKKYISLLVDLFTETSNINFVLGALEQKLLESLKEPTRKGRLAQLEWIKDYVKQHHISDESLINVYLNVLHLNQLLRVKCPEGLTEKESKLALKLRKVISCIYISD